MESTTARSGWRNMVMLSGVAPWAFLLSMVVASAAWGTEPKVEEKSQAAGGQGKFSPSEFSTPNFVVHTDLPSDEALALVERLEATLRTVSNYWRRPLRGTIHCYVAQDVDRWPDGALPHPQAKVLLSRIGGAMIAKRVGRKSAKSRGAAFQATVFALATPGIAEHETVHAYCWQTFGELGPDWYKEGMAEMAYFGRHGGADLQCPADLVEQLRAGPHRTPTDVVERPLTDSVFQALLATTAGDATGGDSLDLWTPAHAATVKDVKHSYLWSWALCHMLTNNPNYSARFRALGQGYVTGQQAKFAEVFAAMDRELQFEFRFMVERMAPGYRADLCRWDWTKRFDRPNGQERVSARVSAARGYQASGLKVAAGEEYAYRATGAWTTGDGRAEADADGDAEGQGRLVGVIEREHRLSPPFDLGASGQFTAPSDGKLHLRCRDDWNQLADNNGTIRVVFQRLASDDVRATGGVGR